MFLKGMEWNANSIQRGGGSHGYRCRLDRPAFYAIALVLGHDRPSVSHNGSQGYSASNIITL